MSSNPRGESVVRWTIVLGVIDTLAVMLRFWVRKKSGTKITTDDWWIMASLVPVYCMIGSASLCELLSSKRSRPDMLISELRRHERRSGKEYSRCDSLRIHAFSQGISHILLRN